LAPHYSTKMLALAMTFLSESKNQAYSTNSIHLIDN
jgi:hypothetical protein